MEEAGPRIRCIRCGAEGRIHENGVAAPCRWLIVWGDPLPLVRRRDSLGGDVVDQEWEGPEWPWRCPRCEPARGSAQASSPPAVGG